MDLYTTSLLLGLVGLAAMALAGVGHGHAGHGHAGHAGHGHAGHGQAGHGHSGPGHVGAGRPGGSGFLWSLMSPRYLFAFALGFGAAGELIKPMLGGPLLLLAAIAGGLAVERFVVAPIWNFSMRFASAPATTLESAVSDEATAVTTFDANGQGIVSLEVDGHVVQILATLQPNDRLIGGQVRAGQRVRIEEVDSTKNCATVSII